MWQAFAGTVLLAVVLAVLGLWALLWAVKHLEDDDAGEADLLADEARGHMASHRLGWQDQRHLSKVQSDLKRDFAARRREAAEVALFRRATSLRQPAAGPSDSDSAA